MTNLPTTDGSKMLDDEASLANEPEDDDDVDAYIGEPLDPDYLTRLGEEDD